MADVLTALDLAFLSLEKPNVHMHVGGISIFDPSTRPGGRLTFGEYSRHFRSRLHRLPRLRQRVQEDAFGWGGLRWAEDPDFELKNHLFHERLPAPGGERELNQLAGWIMSKPLPRDRPLWENHFVEGLAGGRVAVIMKAHHAMEDGLAGLRQTELLFDCEDSLEERRPAPAPRPGGPWALLDRVLNLPLPRDPGAALSRAVAAVAGAGDFLAAGMVAPDSPFNGELGAAREVGTWHARLSEARALHHRLGVSFNDAVLAMVADGLQRYLVGRGVALPERVRVMVPVATRRTRSSDLGNQVSAFLLDVPLDGATAFQSVSRILRATHAARAREEATALAVVEEVGGWFAVPLQRLVTRPFFGQRLFNLVVSDIRGLEHGIRLRGARHLASYPLMPLAQGSGLSIAVLTMGGVFGVGVTSEPQVVPEPQALADAIGGAFRDLQRDSRSAAGSVSVAARVASRRRPRPGTPAARPRRRSAPAARPS